MEEKKKFFKKYKAEVSFAILFIIAMLSMGLNGGFQSDWGNIDVRDVEIRSADGRVLSGKLYRPMTATAANPLPGVLAIHGYNNDVDVQRPHTMELAKRGIVVLQIDCLHQGDSDKGDFVFYGASIPNEAYLWLEDQDFVDGDKTGVVGHSMGALYSQAIALTFPQIDVLGYQAFGADYMSPAVDTLRNYSTNFIQISSTMEEFGGRDWNITIDEWETYNRDTILANTGITGVDDGTGEFFKTYGTIADGNAQRYVWLDKTHPGQTHDLTATKEITSFFLQSLTGMSETVANRSVARTTYIWADFFGALSALALMLSIIPVLSLLIKTKMFGEVGQPMPEKREELKTKNWVWWVFATMNWAIGGVVYMLNTAAPEKLSNLSFWFDARKFATWTPSLDMAVANGFLSFYVVNAIINVVFVILWYVIAGRKRGVKASDMGLYDEKQSWQKNLQIFGKTVVVAIIIFFYMYLFTAFGGWLWNVEVRGPWAMFKTFTVARAGRFFLYYWGVLFFWLFNAGIWLFGLMRQREYGGENKTTFVWWLKIVYAMLVGLILLNVIGYLPMRFGWSGPYFQIFESGFAPMYLLQTWSFIPIAAVMFLIAVYYYRKTGRIYLGILLLAALGTWMMMVGTVMDPFVLGG